MVRFKGVHPGEMGGCIPIIFFEGGMIMHLSLPISDVLVIEKK